MITRVGIAVIVGTSIAIGLIDWAGAVLVVGWCLFIASLVNEDDEPQHYGRSF